MVYIIRDTASQEIYIVIRFTEPYSGNNGADYHEMVNMLSA